MFFAAKSTEYGLLRSYSAEIQNQEASANHLFQRSLRAFELLRSAADARSIGPPTPIGFT